MNFFSGFKWAIPTAFSDSVSKAWFVEGDVFYDHVAAYESDWSTAMNHIQHTIQVRTPARSSGSINQTTREVFSRNWESEVKVALYTHMKRQNPIQIATTQGRLYVTLWKGDVDFLFADKTSHPVMPKMAQQVLKDIQRESSFARTYTKGRATFAMVRDRSNSVLREKFQKIHAILKPHMNEEPVLLTPSDAKLVDVSEIAPTIEIALFPTASICPSKLEDLVKQAVYVPGKDAKKDMFRISSHGILI